MQRLNHGGSSLKSHRYQQSHVASQDWHGGRCNWPYQEMFNLHRQQQPTSGDPTSTQGPIRTFVKVGIDFFQDDFGKMHLNIADYFSKFLFIYPVRSSHHFKTITYLRELFTTEGVPAIVMSDNGPPFNGDDFKNFARVFDFMHTTSSPHFQQSNGFIEVIVQRKLSMHTRKQMVPLQLKQEHCSSYVTHP